MADLSQVLAELRLQRSQLDEAILALEGLFSNQGPSKAAGEDPRGATNTSGAGRPKRVMSASARRRIAAAQRARWAKWHAAQNRG